MVGIKMYAKVQELKSKGYKKQRSAREMGAVCGNRRITSRLSSTS